MGEGGSRRAEALALAEELLGEIELSTLAPAAMIRKASRLARLLDDSEAMDWLSFEVGGYPDRGEGLPRDATAAASRSGRLVAAGDLPKGISGTHYRTESLGRLAVIVESAQLVLQNSSTQPHERVSMRNDAVRSQQVLDAVVGSIHSYVAEQYQELRFGSAVETAFEVVRGDVDKLLGELVPSALPMVSAAFESATSDNPEHWANAAGTCRRLLKAVADALRKPGPEVEGRPMGDGNYINRLIDWIRENSKGDTAADIATADLAYLGDRLDAADGAGQKGAHATVDRSEASRFITGTYLLLGDVLRLAPEATARAVAEDDQHSDSEPS
jgi:hypothetical protein